MSEYEYKRLLSKAVYIINQLEMGFDIAEKHLELNFKRVKKAKSSEMQRLHLPQYIHDDAVKFLADYEKIVEKS